MLQDSSLQLPGLSNIWIVSKNLHDGQPGPESDAFCEPTSADSTSSPLEEDNECFTSQKRKKLAKSTRMKQKTSSNGPQSQDKSLQEKQQNLSQPSKLFKERNSQGKFLPKK